MIRNKFLILLLSFLLMTASSFSVYADMKDLMPAWLSATGSNALMTMDLDSGIMPLSSVGTVTNTVDLDYVVVQGFYYLNGTRYTYYADTEIKNNRLYYDYTAPSGAYIDRINFNLLQLALPPYGNYDFSFDLSSDVGMNVSQVWIYSVKQTDNAANVVFNNQVTFDTLSGDVYVSPYGITLNTYNFMPWIRLADNDVNTISGSVAFNFTPSYDSGEIIGGPNTSEQDYQSGVSSSLSDLSSSVGSMSEDLSSAAENLEYISQSQNLIIQGIDNVILHISDQLYAFWDQLYNLIHLPTYAKLEEILAALRAIANNSDIYQVVEQVKESSEKQTADIIANDNANTAKVEEAVEKHGNFIIEGLKSLFIPSEEFFKSYFDDLYEYFSERFGFLSFPIDLLFRLVDLFVNSSEVDCILTLPSFEISGEELLQESGFNLTEFLEQNFAFLLTAIRTVTSIGMIYAFVHLCQNKWDEVMKN